MNSPRGEDRTNGFHLADIDGFVVRNPGNLQGQPMLAIRPLALLMSFLQRGIRANAGYSGTEPQAITDVMGTLTGYSRKSSFEKSLFQMHGGNFDSHLGTIWLSGPVFSRPRPFADRQEPS
jgi:hypothetical protein